MWMQHIIIIVTATRWKLSQFVVLIVPIPLGRYLSQLSQYRPPCLWPAPTPAPPESDRPYNAAHYAQYSYDTHIREVVERACALWSVAEHGTLHSKLCITIQRKLLLAGSDQAACPAIVYHKQIGGPGIFPSTQPFTSSWVPRSGPAIFGSARNVSSIPTTDTGGVGQLQRATGGPRAKWATRSTGTGSQSSRASSSGSSCPSASPPRCNLSKNS